MTLTQHLARVARSLASGAGLASARFPAATLLVAAMAVLANAEVAGRGLVASGDLGWWFASLFSGAAASVALRLFLESHGASAAVQTAAPVLAALAVGLAVWFSQSLGLFAPPLVAALTFAVFPAPYVRRPDDGRFWSFTLWTLVGAALAFLSVLLFVLGVSAILEMIRFLFEIGLSSRAYEHIYTTALVLVGPLIALGRIPVDFDETAPVLADDRMVQGVRFLLDWVAAPLALATAVVLHLYAAKILVLGSLPKNEVGWIVTFYAGLVLSLRIAADPFLEGGGPFVRGFARAWAAMLVVPLGLLVIAIAERVGPQGWTLERYYLALGALAAVAIVALQAVPRLRPRIRVMAAIPLALLALSSAGPWGAADTVGRSQAGRLAALMAREAPLGPEASYEASTRLSALSDVDELHRAVALVPENKRAEVELATAEGEFAAQSRIAEALGLAAPAAIETGPPDRFFSAGRDTLFPLAGYDVALIDRTVFERDAPGVDRSQAMLIEIEGPDLLVTLDGASDRFPTAPIAAALPAGPESADPSTVSPLDVDLSSASGKRLRVRVRGLTLAGASGRPTILTGMMLLRRADWPGAASLGGVGENGTAEPGGAVGERSR